MKERSTLRFRLSIANTWRGVEFAGLAGLFLAIASILVFTAVTFGAGRTGRTPVPTFLYPYLACVSVFITTCVWILWAARLGTEQQIASASVDSARSWFWWTFIGLFALLMFSGLAGQPGANAVNSLNWYLFGSMPKPSPGGDSSGSLGLPFALLASFSNALALGTLAFLAALCKGLIERACRDDAAALDPAAIAAAAFEVAESSRRLRHYLIMASALTVTSTLTLFLLFETASQIQEIQHPTESAPQPRPESLSPSAAQPFLQLRCIPEVPPQTGYACELRQPEIKTSKRDSSAATMALVAGLSFTGVLFVLFVSCGVALDDRTAELARAGRLSASVCAPPFSMKTWREQSGLEDGGSSGHVIQALTLAAPALTGLLTLIGG